MNKKTILLTVVLLLVVALCIGCGRAESQQEETPGTSQGAGNADKENLDGTEGVEDSIFDDENPPKDDNTSDQQGNKDEQGSDDPDDDSDKPTPPSDTTTPNPGTVTTPPVTDDTTEQDEEMTYEKFISMSPAKQREYQDSFDSVPEFFDWYNAAKEKYEKEHPSIEVDGPIDMEQIAGGNG